MRNSASKVHVEHYNNMNNRTIDDRLNTASTEFKKLALSKFQSPTAANDLLSGHEAWMSCYENNDCAALFEHVEITQAADAFQRSEYYAKHPEKIFPHVETYLAQHPDVLNPYNSHFQNPTFVMKLTQHIDDNPVSYAGISTLLCCFALLRCLNFNPLRLFNCRKNSVTRDDSSSHLKPRKV